MKTPSAVRTRHGQAWDGQPVAGLGDDVAVFSGGKNFLIGGEGVGGGFVAGFAQRTVIDEGADGDAGDELGDASGVVDVVVGEEDVVDVVEAGTFGGGGDAVGVASLVVGPAGIDEEGMVVGGDEEGGLAAFHVDEENLQVAGGVLGAERWRSRRGAGRRRGRQSAGSATQTSWKAPRGENSRPRHHRLRVR